MCTTEASGLGFHGWMDDGLGLVLTFGGCPGTVITDAAGHGSLLLYTLQYSAVDSGNNKGTTTPDKLEDSETA